MPYTDNPIWYFPGIGFTQPGGPCNPLPGCGAPKIIINDNGPASPFPSIIIADATNPTIEIIGLTHSFPDDIDVLIVAPNGNTCVLMSDCGGGSPLFNVNLTFQNGAANELPDASLIVSGNYRPTNKGLQADTFPGVAMPPGGWTTNLAALGGSGEWKLYVVDDTSQDPGTIMTWKINGAGEPTGATGGSLCSQPIVAP